MRDVSTNSAIDCSKITVQLNPSLVSMSNMRTAWFSSTKSVISIEKRRNFISRIRNLWTHHLILPYPSSLQLRMKSSAIRRRIKSLRGRLIISQLPRPDIAFAVSKLCQFNSNPTHTHFKAAKWVLRYVIHTRHYSLKYGCGTDKDHELKLIGYTDSDYGFNLINRKSTMGYAFIFNKGLIS